MGPLEMGTLFLFFVYIITGDCVSVKSYGIGILRNPHAIRLNEDTLFVLDQSK